MMDDSQQDEESFKLDEFRDEVMKLITPKKWNHCIRRTLRKMKNVSKPFAGKYLFVPPFIEGRKSFEEHDEESRKRIMVELVGLDKVRLKFCFLDKKVKQGKLREIYKRYIGPCKGLSNTLVIDNLVSKFYDELMAIEKRSMEKEIMASENLEDVYVELCNSVINKDLIVHILSFMEYDGDLLFRVGASCKSFYITILSTWNELEITKTNLYQISLLVLESVHRLIFDSRLSRKEFEYIWEHVNPMKLETIHFGRKANIEYFKIALTALKRLVRRSKPEDNPLRNVQNLHVSADYSTSSRFLDAYEHLKNFKLVELFPSLRRVTRPFPVSLIDGLDLDYLEIDHSREFALNRNVENAMVEYSKFNLSSRELCLRYFDLGWRRNNTGNKDLSNLFKTIIETIKNVEILDIQRGKNEHTDLTFTIDLQFLSKLIHLHEFRIDFRKKNPTDVKHFIFSKSPPPNLRKVVIFSYPIDNNRNTKHLFEIMNHWKTVKEIKVVLSLHMFLKNTYRAYDYNSPYGRFRIRLARENPEPTRTARNRMCSFVHEEVLSPLFRNFEQYERIKVLVSSRQEDGVDLSDGMECLSEYDKCDIFHFCYDRFTEEIRFQFVGKTKTGELVSHYRGQNANVSLRLFNDLLDGKDDKINIFRLWNEEKIRTIRMQVCEEFQISYVGEKKENVLQRLQEMYLSDKNVEVSNSRSEIVFGKESVVVDDFFVQSK